METRQFDFLALLEWKAERDWSEHALTDKMVGRGRPLCFVYVRIIVTNLRYTKFQKICAESKEQQIVQYFFDFFQVN